MERSVSNLYQGYIGLRDYDVKEAIAKNESIKVKYNSETLTLSPEELITKRVDISSTKFKSKFAGSSDYYLFCYEPDFEETDL